MADDGKRILLFDEQTGMLTKEVMIAYVHGELSPSVRLEVEKFLATSEVHRDMIEGLRNVSDKTQVESAIHAINQQVATRTGAELSTGGIQLEVPSFLFDFKRIAAIITAGFALIACIYLIMSIRDAAPGIAESEAHDQAQAMREEPPAPTTLSEPPSSAAETVDTMTIAAIPQDSVVPNEPLQQEEAGEIAALEKKADSQDTKNKNAPREQAAAKKAIPESNEDASGATSPADTTTFALSTPPPAPVQQDQATRTEADMAQKKAIPLDGLAKDGDEVMPEFPGGEEALKNYIQNNLRYPESARESSIEGKVYLTFTVGTSGRVKDIRVVKGVTKDINAEAIRLIANMPAWTPGKEKGKPIAMKRQLTIAFAPN